MNYIEITNNNYDELCKIAGLRIKWVVDSYSLLYPNVFIGDDDRFIKIVRNSKISNKGSGGYKVDAIKRFIKGVFTTSLNNDRKREALIRVIGIFSKFSNIPADNFLNSRVEGKEFKIMFFDLFNKKNKIKNNKTLNILKSIDNNYFHYLRNSLDAVNLSELENDFKMLKGYYNSFKYFDPFLNEDEGKVSVVRYHIYDIDKENMVLKCRFSSLWDEETFNVWDYEGCIIKAKNELFILLESLKGFHYYPEILSTILRYPEYWEKYNDNNFLLHGVSIALSTKVHPCASRVIFKKMGDEDKLIKSGYYFRDEIKGVNDFEKIEDWIRNKTCNNGKQSLIAPDFLEYRIDDLSLVDGSQSNIIHYIKDRLSLDYNESFQLFKILEDKVFFREYKVNFDRTIELCEVDNDGYRHIKITTDYELKNNNERKDLVFSCNLEGVTTDVVNDENCEVSWIFVPTDKYTECLPDKCFSVDYVNIDGKEYFPEQIIDFDNCKKVKFIVKANLKTSHKIHYIFTVKQAAKYCFVSDYLTKITKNYKVTLDVKDNNIKDVFPKEFLLLSGQHRDTNPKVSDLTKYTVYADGWLFPRSGVSFSWSK
ncbi:MAG: hypothetical protein OMM_04120 [Candidatus Magnetoglobus multicellularis str. Araruama]|uniref:Uncharacterized protein n=1 Tax=Candidatus Magnetoglobus multicellularis str. Araruama TaxID=890399 RepID=A0A1V1P345_9BACT|nr:MAG: hypothetical protein OMM_04120 [Candidatus Magnetoglobus multicellularis str. Araruama]